MRMADGVTPLPVTLRTVGTLSSDTFLSFLFAGAIHLERVVELGRLGGHASLLFHLSSAAYGSCDGGT